MILMLSTRQKAWKSITSSTLPKSSKVSALSDLFILDKPNCLHVLLSSSHLRNCSWVWDSVFLDILSAHLPNKTMSCHFLFSSYLLKCLSSLFSILIHLSGLCYLWDTDRTISLLIVLKSSHLPVLVSTKQSVICFQCKYDQATVKVEIHPYLFSASWENLCIWAWPRSGVLNEVSIVWL